jgi:hypothetical protein
MVAIEENVHAMTNTGTAVRQKAWWKWLVIGISGGVAVAVVAAAVTRSRAAWDTKSVSVVWSEAHETVSIKNGEFEHAGFSVEYALQNNTGRDIIIPESATIMERLTNGGVLVAYSNVAKPSATTFLPAHQRAQLSISILWGCGVSDLNGKILQKEDPEPCFVRCFVDSDGLVLFDKDNRLEIMLPKPIFAKPKR